MIKDLLLPDLGEGIEGAEVSEVSVSVGDKVSPNDIVLVLESDKASMEIPAETPGTIKEVLVAVGDEIEIGQPLFKIEAEKMSQEIGPLKKKIKLDLQIKKKDNNNLDNKETKKVKSEKSVNIKQTKTVKDKYEVVKVSEKKKKSTKTEQIKTKQKTTEAPKTIDKAKQKTTKKVDKKK